VSPYPIQIEREAVLAQARRIIETEGVEQLSLHKLAAALGVKAPSLYRHFASKTDLLREVNWRTNQELVRAVQAAMESAEPTPEARIRAMAHAFRAFAHANPLTYSLVYGNLSPEILPDPAQMQTLVTLLQTTVAELVGPEHSLAALRGARALVHGFVMLELNQQFQMGGDVDAAFVQAVDAYVAGWKIKRG
jgi:AcrR family transcriptional regulator